MTNTENAAALAPPALSPAATARDKPVAPHTLTRNLMPPPRALSLRAFAGRSLFPLITLGLIAGTALWGPWITLALAVVTWSTVGRLG